MKSTKTVLRAALALLLALCCLCGSAVTSFARMPSAAKRSGIVQLGTLLPSDGDETPEVPETPTTPGDSGSTTRTEITVIYFTYPSQVGVGETGSIHITPAPFLTKSADGFWRGVYDGFDVGVTGVSAASMDEGVLRVSPAVATDDGWDIPITGVSAGTASIVLTATELFEDEGSTGTLTKTVSIKVAGTAAAAEHYIYAQSEDGGSVSPAKTVVPESGMVDLALSAKDGYRLDEVLVYDENGKLLDRIDYSKSMSLKDTLRLRNVGQTLYLRLVVAKADAALSNPFKDLKIEDFENPYTDLSTDDWYYEPVAMMSMAGMLDNIDFEEYLPSAAAAQAAFRPASGAFRVTTLAAADSGPARKAATKRIFGKSVGTRAVTVMELHNAADNLNLTSGSYTKSPFADVKPGKSCFQAVLWAVDKSIVFGYGNGYFGTYDSITREQMCAILLRTAQKSGMTLPQTVEAKNFTDSAAVSSWAQSAVTACAEAGIINGFPDGSFKPKSSIMNGELTTMIYRFLNLLP